MGAVFNPLVRDTSRSFRATLCLSLASVLQPRRTRPMRLRVVSCSAAAAVFMFAVNCSCLAAESPGAAEAKALLDKAVAYFDKNGVARAFCVFNEPKGDFHKRPVYVFDTYMHVYIFSELC